MICVPEGKDEQTLDFNLIIPMPEVVKGTSAGGDVDLGIEILTGQPIPGKSSCLDLLRVQKLGITTLEELRSWAEKERPNAIQDGEKAIAAYRETGFYDWYDWSIENWGTKWNSYSLRIEEDLGDGALSFYFDTAWSFPIPIFKKLARMFPGLRFECICFDEGWWFAGRGAFNGQPVFRFVEPTDELYEAVYGYKPRREEEDDDCRHMLAFE
jgi:Api92-like protein with ferredoxin domain